MSDATWCDYAYGSPDVSAYEGVLRYLPVAGSPRDNLTRAEVDRHHAAGRAVGLIWESNKADRWPRISAGQDGGREVVRLANAAADALGAPGGVPIFYADTDDDYTADQVDGYLRGLLAEPGRPSGSYGSDVVLERAASLGIPWLWQAAATGWGRGTLSPLAHLRQRIFTKSLDEDVALQPFPAWWPKGINMATPMTPDQMLNALRAEGLKVVEVRSWRSNDRAPATGRPAGPKRGTVNHHTGSDTDDPARYAASILYDGYSGLPGPICHAGLDVDTGTVYLVGTGRTNHAGGGDPVVLDRVIADTVPFDTELRPTKGNLDGVDGNGPFYGLEMMYSGGHPLPAAGYDACVRWNAAICRFHGWTGHSVIGHREWSDDKPDPGNVDLARLRRDVQARLDQPANTDTPPPPVGDQRMNMQESDQAAAIVLAIGRSEGAAGSRDAHYNGNEQAKAAVDALTETVKQLNPEIDPAALSTALRDGVAAALKDAAAKQRALKKKALRRDAAAYTPMEAFAEKVLGGFRGDAISGGSDTRYNGNADLMASMAVLRAAVAQVASGQPISQAALTDAAQSAASAVFEQALAQAQVLQDAAESGRPLAAVFAATRGEDAPPACATPSRHNV